MTNLCKLDAKTTVTIVENSMMLGATLGRLWSVILQTTELHDKKKVDWSCDAAKRAQKHFQLP